MALGKNKKIINLVQSISEMKEENYAAGSPELQNMYERMSAGRRQLAQVYGEDAKYAGAINVMTTLFCIFTMPVLVFIYQAVM